MRHFCALLTILFAVSFLAGPVTGAQAAEQPQATCAMHAQEPPADAPAKAALHNCKTCIGCAPAPTQAVALTPLAAPAILHAIEWNAPAGLSAGRTTQPDPAPPRARF